MCRETLTAICTWDLAYLCFSESALIPVNGIVNAHKLVKFRPGNPLTNETSIHIYNLTRDSIFLGVR